MAVSSPTFRPIVSVGAPSLTIEEYITVLGSVSIALPDETRGFILRSRSTCTLNMSDSLGGPSITIKPHCTLQVENLGITGKILYIESSIPITTIEVLITHG